MIQGYGEVYSFTAAWMLSHLGTASWVLLHSTLCAVQPQAMYGSSHEPRSDVPAAVQYFKEDDDFGWNFGIALANTNSWAEVRTSCYTALGALPLPMPAA